MVAWIARRSVEWVKDESVGMQCDVDCGFIVRITIDPFLGLSCSHNAQGDSQSPDQRAMNTKSTTDGTLLSPPTCSQFSDTDRLNYLLQFVAIDDVGDEEYCKGIVVSYEEMEEKVGLGPPDETGRMEGTIREWNDDLRDVIDRAMVLHSFANVYRETPPFTAVVSTMLFALCFSHLKDVMAYSFQLLKYF